MPCSSRSRCEFSGASPLLRAVFRPPRGRVHPRPEWVASLDLASRSERVNASLPAQRVLHAANGIADFPADLVGFSFSFELLVARRLAGDLLDLALGLLSRTLDAILIHCMSPVVVTGERRCRRQGSARSYQPRLSDN